MSASEIPEKKKKKKKKKTMWRGDVPTGWLPRASSAVQNPLIASLELSVHQFQPQRKASWEHPSRFDRVDIPAMRPQTLRRLRCHAMSLVAPLKNNHTSNPQACRCSSWEHPRYLARAFCLSSVGVNPRTTNRYAKWRTWPARVNFVYNKALLKRLNGIASLDGSKEKLESMNLESLFRHQTCQFRAWSLQSSSSIRRQVPLAAWHEGEPSGPGKCRCSDSPSKEMQKPLPHGYATLVFPG